MLVFMDGFDHYGGDKDNMLDGVYLQSENSISATQFRTGALALKYGGGASSYTRRGLGDNMQVVGVGLAFYITALPSISNLAHLGNFRNDSNTQQVGIYLTTTGNINVYRGTPPAQGGSGVIIASTTDQPVVAEAWTHIEWKVKIDDTVGYIEVRLNGVTIINETGLDTDFSGGGVVAQYMTPGANTIGVGGYDCYIDDLFVWNDQGSENNDFLGDLRVLTVFPDGNGADQDWTANGASAEYDCIDEDPANGDTDYLEVDDTSLPARCNFTLEDLGTEVSAIKGVQTYVNQKKTEAGVCSTQVSMGQGSDETAGGVNAMTTLYTEYTDMFELDPATGALWTRTGFNSSQLIIDRTA